MRKIEFRGKRIDNGEWVYGDLLHVCDGFVIITADEYIGGTHSDTVGLEFDLEDVAAVKTKTIGQYTGLTDRKGNKIFEGDILVCGQWVGLVLWNEELATFALQFDFESKVGATSLGAWQTMTVVGNIHDYPNLMKGDQQ